MILNQNMSIAKIRTKINSMNSNGVSKKIGEITNNLKYTPTIISSDLVIDGKIDSKGLIEIEGVIKGTINGNSIIIREDGFVQGFISSEFLNIRGKFEGTIRAKNISISSKANVVGDIEYESLAVEDGASIDGQFKKNQV